MDGIGGVCLKSLKSWVFSPKLKLTYSWLGHLRVRLNRLIFGFYGFPKNQSKHTLKNLEMRECEILIGFTFDKT